MAFTTLILFKHSFGGMYWWRKQLKVFSATPPTWDDCFGFYPLSLSNEPGEKLYIALIIFELSVDVTFRTKSYVEALLLEV